jgi:hypothetical protein
MPCTSSDLPYIMSGSWSSPVYGSTFASGEVATLACDYGYTLSGDDPGQSFVTCANGQFSNTLTLMDCVVGSPSPGGVGDCDVSNLPIITGGTWSQPDVGSTFPAGSAASLTCNPGYSVSPPGAAAYAMCSSAKFGTTTATCAQDTASNAPTCSAPPVVANGVWENPFDHLTRFTVGSALSLDCNPGFTEKPAGAALQCGSAFGVDQWTGAGLAAFCVASGSHH